MNEETKEILEHLKEYLQGKIDIGINKIFYNDNGADEKIVDMINAITKLQEENDRLNNIIKHIYKELREFDVCNNMGVAMQISYLEEYIQKNIEQIEDKYLQELKEGK